MLNSIDNKNIINVRKIFQGRRILICGKGGSGKSTIITLLARTLASLDCKVIMLDADASNPGGLCRMLFGPIAPPKPLIDFFGGREKVECPVDNPSPLTRINNDLPIIENPLNLKEIPIEYYHKENNITIFQVGKINQPYEGCDGPMSKIARDFVLDDEGIILIDVEAGIEHYGRGIEKNIDIVLVTVDPTFESVLIAEKVHYLCGIMNINNVWIIINKIHTEEEKSILMDELQKTEVNILGIVYFDEKILNAGLRGLPIQNYDIHNEIHNMLTDLILKLK